MAVRHLQADGYQILTRNWRCTHPDVRGEVDIVARDGAALVICEVKTRRGEAAGDPLAAVTPAKVAQLRRLTAAYLGACGGGAATVRIDVVGISWPSGGGRATVEHVRDIDDLRGR